MFETAVQPPVRGCDMASSDRHGHWTADHEPVPAQRDFEMWEHDVLAERTWASTAPSGIAALELDVDTSEPDALSDAQLIDAMVGFERLTAWAQARQARVVAAFARRRPPDDRSLAGTDRTSVTSPYAPDEVGLALHLSRWSATARIGQSVELVERLPETLSAWEAGRLDERRVTAICDATRNLAPDRARAVQDRVSARAPEQTLAQLKAALARAVIAEDPLGAAERHRSARRERRVAVNQEKDGMASMWALLSAPDALASYQWLSRLARGCGAEDPRSMDARRADLLVALLTGQLTRAAAHGDTGTRAADGAATGSTSADSPYVSTLLPRPVNPGKPLVQVVMPFTTLIGADDQACELVGHGAIPAELAREIASDSTLQRLVYDPLSGTVLDHGRTTYRPPAALADHVRARDVYCRQPICRRRAADSELDHLVPFPRGTTSEQNLAGTCSHDHHMKHAPGWQVRARSRGRIEWITPTGHSYFSDPYDYRPDPDPPPATAARAALVEAIMSSGPPQAESAAVLTPQSTADPDPPPF